MIIVEWPTTPPLPRLIGLTFSTSLLGILNRRGIYALNAVRPELRTFKNVYSGFRLARNSLEET